MPTPDFVLSLREKIGHDLLWLPGVSAVVFRAAEDSPTGREQVLLVRRADNGQWTPTTGIIDPGEEPAVAGSREVLEETEVVAEPVALVRVHTLPPMTYANGDNSQYLDLTFRFAWVSGEPGPGDGENSESRWFHLNELPQMSAEMLDRIEHARTPELGARFGR